MYKHVQNISSTRQSMSCVPQLRIYSSAMPYIYDTKVYHTVGFSQRMGYISPSHTNQKVFFTCSNFKCSAQWVGGSWGGGIKIGKIPPLSNHSEGGEGYSTRGREIMIYVEIYECQYQYKKYHGVNTATLQLFVGNAISI